MLVFMDGGIINGTPIFVTLEDQILFMSQADSFFIVAALSTIFMHIAFYFQYVAQ